jgi:O-antigen ligase
VHTTFPLLNKQISQRTVASSQTTSSTVLVRQEGSQLPIIVWVVVIATGAAFFGGEGVFGYRMSGLAWVIPLFFSILAVLRNSTRIRFPYKIWLPWLSVLLVYVPFSEFRSLQRTIQLICPLIVGAAVSTCSTDPFQFMQFVRLSKGFSVAICLIALLNTGVLLTGRIPLVTGLSAQAMTGVLLCSLFAASYSAGNRKDLFWWALMAALPVFAVTRTTMLAAGITLPLTLGPMGLKKRVLILMAVSLVSLGLFHTERVQRKMFYSGQGEISDIRSQDFKDTGRFRLWDLMKVRIRQKPWFGHGTGSGEAYVVSITGGLRYPHNDWLLTLHDQGILGTSVFAVCILMALTHAWRRAAQESGDLRVLFLAGASAFIPFAVIMFSDNVMIYASYFGNLHFTILGLAYAASASKGDECKEAS